MSSSVPKNGTAWGNRRTQIDQVYDVLRSDIGMHRGEIEFLLPNVPSQNIHTLLRRLIAKRLVRSYQPEPGARVVFIKQHHE